MKFDHNQMLARYADLVIQIGANIQPGQRLLLGAPIETAPLARLITASAYRAGARFVDVVWQDDQIELARFNNAPRDSFEEYQTWYTDLLLEYAQRGDAFIDIYANDPDLLAAQDPELVSIARRTSARYIQPINDLLMRNTAPWSIVSAPIPSWAAKVFPAHSPEEQVARLWGLIFSVCRLDHDDPIGAWDTHIGRLEAWASYLNGRRYDALHYRAPGTDLTIGLPQGHVWKAARDTAASGLAFMPNLPTEEVFTMPHMARVDGVVSATMPLNLSSTLVENLKVTFENGLVINVSATAGEEHMRNLLATDEGASRLGEVALVPHSSPISQSGVLFYNTLFDENAASHIALGKAYPYTLEGGNAMSNEQLAAAGGNDSLTHVDFMIGSSKMNVDGIRADGTVEPVMRSGEWAFDTAN